MIVRAHRGQLALSLRPTACRLAVAAVGLLLAGCLGLLLDHARPTPAPISPVVLPDRRLAGERAVETAQRRLAAAPEAPRAQVQLAQAYLLRARESGDPAYYSRADQLIKSALAAQPDDLDAILAAGSLALSRHEFAAGLGWAERAVALAPQRAAAYGLLVDSLVELGRYPEAVRAAQSMIDLRPDQASYARVAYLRELHGDLEGATEAMRRAVQAGPPDGEATAWAEVQLGHLLFAAGDLAAAERAYGNALLRFDGYAYALAGQARVRAAQDDLAGAAALYERAAQAMPLPEFVIALGDTYARLGDARRAEQQYALLAAMQQLLAANGVRTDVQSHQLSGGPR